MAYDNVKSIFFFYITITLGTYPCTEMLVQTGSRGNWPMSQPWVPSGQRTGELGLGMRHNQSFT